MFRKGTKTHSRHATVALTAAMLLAAALTLAGNGRATALGGNGQRVDQLGPKYLSGARHIRMRPTTAARRRIRITTLCEDELGPKYLLSHC